MEEFKRNPLKYIKILKKWWGVKKELIMLKENILNGLSEAIELVKIMHSGESDEYVSYVIKALKNASSIITDLKDCHFEKSANSGGRNYDS